MVYWRVLIIAWMVAGVGCVTVDRSAERPAPVVISASTWQQVDRDIVTASQAATEQAQNYAHEAMESWMDLVYQHTDTDYIPWFSSYWTQQWLTVKVAWYRLNAKDEADPVADHLTVYLQEQYQDRVLDPVAKKIDPELVMEQATKRYVRLLGEQLQEISRRYALPQEQFDRRLGSIPAIALAPPASHNASLYQMVRADPLDRLPAYVALLGHIRHAGHDADSADTRLSSVAQRTSATLQTQLATSSAASAVSSVVGRVAGMAISMGVAAFTAVARANERPEMEALLRKNLNGAFDDEWLDLMWNLDTGVLAGVYSLSRQIEGSLMASATPPARLEPLPQAVSLPGEQPLQDDRSVFDTPLGGGGADH